MNVKRLNHAVLWVRDARASAAFYGDALGFQVVETDPSGRAVFMRAGGSDNRHDLGLFSVGERPSPAPGTPLWASMMAVDTGIPGRRLNWCAACAVRVPDVHPGLRRDPGILDPTTSASFG